MRGFSMTQFVGALFLCAGLVLSPTASAQTAQETETAPIVRISTFSGREVPRFESLASSEVNGRQGPSTNDRILWRYQREGLPVLIVKETRDWRKVRDPDGSESWIYYQLLSSRQTAYVRRDTVMFTEADAESRPRAELRAGVVTKLHGCQSGWCSVEADRRTGWVRADTLWGTAEAISETGV